MKYITLIIGLLVVGCGKQEQTLTAEEKKVIGTYEMEGGGDTFSAVFLDNGIIENYKNGIREEEEDKWKIVDGELHVIHETGIAVFRINKDGNITGIADIEDGKREDFPKESLVPLKKIK